jgi:hypothetical protein
VYSIDTENAVMDITEKDLNTLYPSPYLSIYNEMIGYTGSKKLMLDNFKYYKIEKELYPEGEWCRITLGG